MSATVFSDIKLETVTASDGTTLPLHVFVPDGGAASPAPALMLFQDTYGYNTYLQGMARRFASLGLITAVPELYHRTGIGVGVEYDEPGADNDSNQRHRDAMTPATMVIDAQAAFAWLSAQPHIAADRIAALGFCMGGRLAFLANAHMPLRAAVSLYGGHIAPHLLEHAKTQHAPILMMWGGADAHIPAAQRRAVADALTAAGKLHDQVVFSDALHGYWNPRNYNAHAADVSWSTIVAFLHSTGVLRPDA